MDTESSVTPPARSTPKISRRVFTKRLVGGLAIAVPALRVLASTSPAAAEPSCCSGTVHLVSQGHDCGRYSNTCPSGTGQRCIHTYYVYCTSGAFCRSLFDDDGPCRV